jgi:hypothetical protein
MSESATPLGTESIFYSEDSTSGQDQDLSDEQSSEGVTETVDEAAQDEELASSESEEASAENAEAENDNTEESDQQESDADASPEESEALFVDLGEDEYVTIEDIKQLQKEGMLEKHFTQERQKDAVVQKENLELKTQLGEKSAVFDSKLEEVGALFSKLQEDGFVSDEEATEMKVKLEGLRAEQQATTDATTQAYNQAEHQALFDANPDWMAEGKTTPKFDQDKAVINQYFVDNGFNNSEVETLASSKLMIAVHKAAKYDALSKKSVETKEKLKTVPLVKKTKPKQKPVTPVKTTAAERFYGKDT